MCVFSDIHMTLTLIQLMLDLDLNLLEMFCVSKMKFVGLSIETLEPEQDTDTLFLRL